MAGNASGRKRMNSVAGPANTSTKKMFNGVAGEAVNMSSPPRFAKVANEGPMKAGEMADTRGMGSPFAKPLNSTGVSAEIGALGKTYNDIGEMSGFITDGYLDKGGTPFGEAAKFNFLPPGMDISNQENVEINEMPLRKIVAESYPGDGWMPAPRDIPE